MTDDSFRADRNDVMEMRPANSNPGFASVSLRVPSCDPLPSNDDSKVRLTVPAHIERAPGREHAYHTLEPPNLALGRTGGSSGREEGQGRGAGGVVALNPDNRTNLREVTQGTPRDKLGSKERLGGSFTTHQKQPKNGGADVPSSPQRAKPKVVNSNLPPIPVIESVEKGEVGYINTAHREKGPEDPHNYDDIDLKDTKAEPGKDHYIDTIDRKKNADGYDEINLKDQAAIKAKPAVEHEYDVLDDDKNMPTSRFLAEREAVYPDHVLKSSPPKESSTKQQVSAAREAVYTPHVLKPKPPSQKEAIANSSKLQISASKVATPSCSEAYDDVIGPGLLLSKGTAADKKHVGERVLSQRRTTYSSTFDDPMYDAAFSGCEENSLPRRGTYNITSSLGDSLPPHSRTQSMMQVKKSRAPRQDYELTENLTVGDVLSEPEHSHLWKETIPCLPAAIKSSDSTNLFDDPEYGLGLNLKR